MESLGRNVFKNSILFTVGGIGYYGIELMYRSYSHWTMILVGGIIFILIGLINEFLEWETPLYQQCAIATFIIVNVEFVAGCIVNILLKWQVWDYSDLPFNVMGQICLTYTILWYFLSVIGIILDDFVRWKLFNEKFEGYKIF